ncbi:hypothetical protein AVEN_14941-1, partial [Araneus ventricosus]
MCRLLRNEFGDPYPQNEQQDSSPTKRNASVLLFVLGLPARPRISTCIRTRIPPTDLVSQYRFGLPVRIRTPRSRLND